MASEDEAVEAISDGGDFDIAGGDDGAMPASSSGGIRRELPRAPGEDAQVALREAHDPACRSEVLHFRTGRSPSVMLTSRADSRQLLEHAGTGERVLLPDGCSWQLAFSPDGWAYTWAHGMDTVWASSWFQQSLWMTRGGVYFVRIKGPGNSFTVRLLGEHATHYTTENVAWPASDSNGIVAMSGARVHRASVPRSGASYFWQLIDMQDACGFSAKWARGSKWIQSSMRKWQPLLHKVGVPEDHVQRPFLRTEGSDHTALRTQHQTWCLSTAAYITLMCHLANTMKSPYDKRRVLGVLRGLLAFALPSEGFEVWLHPFNLASPVDPSRAHHERLIFRNGELCEWHGNFKDLPAQELNRARSICGLLVGSYTLRLKGVFSGLVIGTAKVCEEHLRGRTGAELVMASIADATAKPHRRADRALRVLVDSAESQGVARSGRRASITARALGVNIPVHDYWADSAATRRSLVAARRALMPCVSFGTNPDNSRIAGKDYFCSSIFGHETLSISFAPPMVI